MKIILTNAPFYGEGFHGIRAGGRWPFIFNYPLQEENSLGGYNTMPFFLAYATNYLISKSVGDVYYYDALAMKHRFETFYKTVGDIMPDIVLMETSTPSIEIDIKVATKLKEMGIEVCFTGPHATTYAETLIKNPNIDYILKGEYEVSSYEMCVMRKKGIYESKPIMDISGMYPYRDNTVYQYSDGFGQDAHIEMPQLQMQSSRGCPYKCAFCLWNSTMTNKYRVNDSSHVIRELTWCMKTFGFKSVLFDDDTFNVGDKRTKEMSDLMGKIHIQWHAMVRPDACSWSAFEAMRRSGCVGLKMGVESFNQNSLDMLGKKYDVKELIATIDHVLKLGFKPFLSMMDNIPGETEDDKKRTKEILDGFLARGASMQHPNCMPLPGTRLHEQLDTNEDWFEYGKFHGEVIK